MSLTNEEMVGVLEDEDSPLKRLANVAAGAGAAWAADGRHSDHTPMTAMSMGWLQGFLAALCFTEFHPEAMKDFATRVPYNPVYNDALAGELASLAAMKALGYPVDKKRMTELASIALESVMKRMVASINDEPSLARCEACNSEWSIDSLEQHDWTCLCGAKVADPRTTPGEELV